MVPVNMPVVIEKAQGNASVRGMKGPLDIRRVNGNLAVQQSRKVSILRVSGNCLVQDISDELNIDRISGNLKGKDVVGMVNIDRVSAYAELYDLQSGTEIRSNGDIHLGLATNISEAVNLPTSADIFLNLLADAGAQFHVKSGAHKTEIQIDGLEERIRERSHVTLIGDGSRKIKLEAAGRVVIKGEKKEDKKILKLFEELENLWVELKEENFVRRKARDEKNPPEVELVKDTAGLAKEAVNEVAGAASLIAQLAENAVKLAEERVQQAVIRVKHRLHDPGYKTRFRAILLLMMVIIDMGLRFQQKNVW